MVDRLAAAATPTVTQLTLDEKALLVEGVDAWRTNAVPRLGVRSLFVTDGPHGVRKVRDATGGGFSIGDNEASSAFPTSSAVAASWNPDNAFRMARAIAYEARAAGVDIVLAPGVNIKRSPLCGRNFEYYSEDPLVSGVFGSAFVRGAQSAGVGCSVKHFAANSNEDFRFVGDSLVDERALREIYLRAFERVVAEADPWTLMCSYNRVNGVFASENVPLLHDILRDEWGYEGVVLTDWGATHDRVAGVRAGCDLDMPGQVAYNRERLTEAARDPEFAAHLDRSAARMLALVARADEALGIPVPDEPGDAESLALSIAVDSAVLLANDGTLPLGPTSGRLLVVGEMFEQLRYQGGGSSLITPPEIITPREAFDRRGIEYRFELGYRTGPVSTPSNFLARSALIAASEADTIVFFGGLSDFEESEGFDRTHLALGAAQESLLGELVATGVPVVLVLFAGSAVTLPAAADLAAILDLHLPGMHGGEAAAALLFGEANPSGKLTESWPRHLEDTSAFADFDHGPIARYMESIYVGYRFYDAVGTELCYPFGHGLSYTRFRYDDLDVEVRDDFVHVRFRLTNTGERDGSEVVQVYVAKPESPIFRPQKELRAFTKVFVEAGETAAVELSFELSDLEFWNVARHGWELENGAYDVHVAASAADIRLTASIDVTSGVNSVSPYSPHVDRDYAVPPRGVSDSFPELLGRPVPTPRHHATLTMETRLGDTRTTFVGWVVNALVMGSLRRTFRKALRRPESLERESQVKTAYFVLRMMPNISLRALVMSSAGEFPFAVAVGLTQIAAGHPIAGLRSMLRRPRRTPRTAGARVLG